MITAEGFERVNSDVVINIENNGERIRFIFGKDGYLWCGTPHGGGYSPQNIADWIAETLNDWMNNESAE